MIIANQAHETKVTECRALVTSSSATYSRAFSENKILEMRITFYSPKYILVTQFRNQSRNHIIPHSTSQGASTKSCATVD
jgi:hypothetical protein